MSQIRERKCQSAMTIPVDGSRGADTRAATWLRPVAAALDAATVPARFFFRDDDAGWGDARLLALLDVFEARATWVDLAVIPRALGAGLARELLTRDRVGLHQHGLAHANHEPEGSRKCEFGPARTAAHQRADIAEGRERLTELLGDRLDPVFTPPWNRCTVDTARCVADLGFRALSRESRAEPFGLPGLAEVPVCVDWVRLDPDQAAERIAAGVRGGGRVGVMLHHEVMDDASMRRLDDLLALVASTEAAQPGPL
jgi:hypothetical protein